MAYTDVTAASFFDSILGGSEKVFNIPLFDSTGAPVDLSAWSSFTAAAAPAGGANLNGSGILAPPVVGTATGIKMTISHAVSAAMFPGQYQVAVTGIPVALDDPQTLLTGQLSVSLPPI